MAQDLTDYTLLFGEQLTGGTPYEFQFPNCCSLRMVVCPADPTAPGITVEVSADGSAWTQVELSGVPAVSALYEVVTESVNKFIRVTTAGDAKVIGFAGKCRCRNPEDEFIVVTPSDDPSGPPPNNGGDGDGCCDETNDLLAQLLAQFQALLEPCEGPVDVTSQKILLDVDPDAKLVSDSACVMRWQTTQGAVYYIPACHVCWHGPDTENAGRYCVQLSCGTTLSVPEACANAGPGGLGGIIQYVERCSCNGGGGAGQPNNQGTTANGDDIILCDMIDEDGVCYVKATTRRVVVTFDGDGTPQIAISNVELGTFTDETFQTEYTPVGESTKKPDPIDLLCEKIEQLISGDGWECPTEGEGE